MMYWPMQLYDFLKFGNCYKARLFLSILNIEYTLTPVDIMAGEHQSDEFLAVNPEGMVPVLCDDVILPESAAILVYLARQYADSQWLPEDPLQLATVVRWMVFEQNEGRYGLARSRAINLKLHTALAKTGSLKESQRIGVGALAMLDRQLASLQWLAGTNNPTIADIACYPYTLLAPEGGLSLSDFPAVQRWLDDMRNIPGYCKFID